MKQAKVIALGFSLFFPLAGCARFSSHPREQPKIIRVSSEETSVFSAFSNLPGIAIRKTEIAGSEKRLVALQQGSLDLAVAVADVAYAGFNGQLPGQSQPLNRIRAIAVLDTAVVHILIGPTVDSNRQLRTMRVAMSDSAVTGAPLGERLINSLKLSGSVTRIELSSRDHSLDNLLSGNLDALIVIGPLPQEWIRRALRAGAHLRGIDDSEIDAFRSDYPLIRRTSIPRGTYPSQSAPVHSAEVDLLLVCRADLDTDLAHELTRAYFERSGELVRAVPARAPASVIPLHVGAATYYREREVSR